MAKTFEAPFPQTPLSADAVCVAAATYADDAPANTVELLTAGTDGAVVTRISAMPRSTVGAMGLLVWVQKSGTSLKRLKTSAVMAAQTVNTTTKNTPTMFEYSESSALRLGAGDKVFVGTAVALAAGVVFSAEYTNY